jgi:HD superfamily phosphohydrolase
MKAIWEGLTPPLRPMDIVKLAVGPRKATDLTFSTWEVILAEIIVGDAFGVDRIDYLLRDSYHTGVAYGKFDHFRLIDTLRILPSAPGGAGALTEPALGIEEGGIYSAEALMLARYFMYSQVYFHPVRRIYDIHLKDFLTEWLPAGKFPTALEEHLRVTDNEVTARLWRAAAEPAQAGHDPAQRIVGHKHFRLLYQRHPADAAQNREAGMAIFEAAKAHFGPENVRHDKYTQKSGAPDFPVQTKDGRIVSSLELSEPLKNLPVVALDYVFIRPEKWDDANRWLQANRAAVIQPRGEPSA